MMKKKIINILKYIVICSIFWCFFPLLVFADATYLGLSSDVCYVNFNQVSMNHYTKSFRSTGEIRAVILRTTDTKTTGYLYVVSDQPLYMSSVSSNSAPNACSATYNAISTQQDGYYVSRTENTIISNNPFGIPVITEQYAANNASGIWYTFGPGSVDPVEPINWGLVRDPEYSTRIAGNGYAAKRNIDYLTWNNEVDSNGNDISECSINIKAVLGSWSGTTQEDLLNKTYNDFNIGSYSSINLGSVPASSGMFSVSWQRIIDEAGWNFDSLYSHFEDNIFLKQGWYYQLQLVDPDGGVHQWQTLYTPLSSCAKSSEIIINHNSFDQDIYQIYEELTQINNNTSITINIEDTDYTVQNPDNGDEPQEGVDLWDILKQMLNGIFQIIKNIAALPGKFLEMIQHLITPPQQISEEINTNLNNNMQDLNESQPGLMESMNAVEDIQDTLNQSVNSFNGVPECIFTWDAVTLDLSAFQVGIVTFIPAGSFDFAASFMQMITGFGMTYAEYQFYVSAIIYAWILVFIYRHVYAFLAGTKEE